MVWRVGLASAIGATTLGGCADGADEPTPGADKPVGGAAREPAAGPDDSRGAGVPAGSPATAGAPASPSPQSCAYEFAPPSVPEVDPCGGNPAGTWVTEDFQFPYLRIDTVGTNHTIYGSCNAQIVEGDGAALEDFFWRLELDTLQFDVEVDIPPLDVLVYRENSCFREAAGGGSCDTSLKPPCRLSCGVCACDVSEEGDGATLRFNLQEGTAALNLWGRSETFNYCVTGDVLELSSAEAGMYIRLKHPSGCRRGACRGTGVCNGAYRQDHCEQRLDCEWFPDECNDDPCQLEEYGVNPACML